MLASSVCGLGGVCCVNDETYEIWKQNVEFSHSKEPLMYNKQ